MKIIDGSVVAKPTERVMLAKRLRLRRDFGAARCMRGTGWVLTNTPLSCRSFPWVWVFRPGWVWVVCEKSCPSDPATRFPARLIFHGLGLPDIAAIVVLALMSRNPTWIRMHMLAYLGKPLYPGS
jgi:hypothetical protein